MFLARGPETNQHRHTQTEISKVNSTTCTSHTHKRNEQNQVNCQ